MYIYIYLLYVYVYKKTRIGKQIKYRNTTVEVDLLQRYLIVYENLKQIVSMVCRWKPWHLHHSFVYAYPFV